MYYDAGVPAFNSSAAQSYDLFLHNCNNFSNDFAMFLVGRGIPAHITSLPQTVLNTPFGQMLRPQLDSAMRSMTQAPIPPQSLATPRMTKPPSDASGGSRLRSTASNLQPTDSRGKVHNVVSAQILQNLLDGASASCAVVFFTSANCPPCKLAYPAYDELASEIRGKATLIKVDIDKARELAAQYSIRATPTFVTYLKGIQHETWTGANPAQLLSKIRLLVQTAFPPHPHQSLHLPTLHNASLRPVLFSKVPPLDKVVGKLGGRSDDVAVDGAIKFIKTRQHDGAKEAPLPNLPVFAKFLRENLPKLPEEARFAPVDLWRLMMVDARVAGFFASEKGCETMAMVLKHVHGLEHCPYNLRLVALQACSNIFSSPIFADQSLKAEGFCGELIGFLSTSLADKQHTNVRVAATSAALNIANSVCRVRSEGQAGGPGITEGLQVELLAALLEALSVEQESSETIRGLVLAAARLVYCAPAEHEVLDLCRAMDAASIVTGAGKFVAEGDANLVREVASELMGKGLVERQGA